MFWTLTVYSMKSLYYFPSASQNSYSNPYSIYYKKALEPYFNVLEKKNEPAKILSWSFLKSAFIADVFIVNWLESIPFLRLGYIQYLLVLCGLKIICWRKKKIVWMFHNIHPHQGNNKYSKKIQNILFKQATLIISHSKEATKYARQKTEKEVIYKCHPISTILVKPFKKKVNQCDVLIWGTILPYKGIYEFVSDKEIQNSNLRIRIIGKCLDTELCDKIKSQCNKYITFENRRIDFEELAACCKQSRYVLFPYVGNCVSSSGALIDTIALGGTPIGPHIGAFKDLAKEGVCLTYTDYGNLILILKKNIIISDALKNDFMNHNSWQEFAVQLYNIIK